MPFIDRGDDVHLWWDERGSGPAALLVQGLGYPSDMWHRLLPVLARERRVLTMDNRGVGRTGVPKGPFTLADLAQDAVAVLDAAGQERADVVGVSMGGLVVQELALAHPDRVRSLVLGCTHPGGADAVFTEEARALLGGRGGMSPEEAAEASVPFVYADGTPRSRIEEDLAIRRAVPTRPEGYLAQLGGAVASRGTGDRLPGLRVPTLVVHGTADRLVPVENGRFVAAAVPGAVLHLLEGASHIFWTDQPDATAELLLTWLRR